jgi:hypothetical protein
MKVKTNIRSDQGGEPRAHPSGSPLQGFWAAAIPDDLNPLIGVRGFGEYTLAHASGTVSARSSTRLRMIPPAQRHAGRCPGCPGTEIMRNRTTALSPANRRRTCLYPQYQHAIGFCTARPLPRAVSGDSGRLTAVRRADPSERNGTYPTSRPSNLQARR